jgi:RNA polymerase sigma-70 factor (ECF subfamily)
LSKLKDARIFAVWLYRIARNKVYDGFRRKDRFLRLPEENELPLSGSAEPVFDANDTEKLHRALNTLKPHHREVLTLCFIEQMPYQSIADVVGCSIGTVRSRIFYAKKSLRQEMESQNG